MTHITCRLTAKNRDQLRNPMLGNRVWAIFTFFMLNTSIACCPLANMVEVSTTSKYDPKVPLSVREFELFTD